MEDVYRLCRKRVFSFSMCPQRGHAAPPLLPQPAIWRMQAPIAVAREHAPMRRGYGIAKGRYTVLSWHQDLQSSELPSCSPSRHVRHLGKCRRSRLIARAKSLRGSSVARQTPLPAVLRRTITMPSREATSIEQLLEISTATRRTGLPSLPLRSTWTSISLSFFAMNGGSFSFG